MINVVLQAYEKYQKKRILKNCFHQAEIGSMFDIEIGARIANESGVKDNIRIGNNTYLAGGLRTSPHAKLSIGNYCYISTGAFIGAANSIQIGNYVGIAHYTFVVDNNNHPVEPEARKEHRIRVAPGGEGYLSVGASWEMSKNAPIVIEDNVWIGMYCFIGKGVTIGEGSIVARQSVVTKDVPPFTVVAGNPARVVKQLEKDYVDFPVKL